MTSISWSWDEFWWWFEQIEEQERQFDALREVHKDKWVERLPAELQAKVFLNAPMDFKMQMKNFPNLYKREAILILQMHADRQNKQFKRYSRR